MINKMPGSNCSFTGLRLANNFTKEKLFTTTQEGGKSTMAVLNGLSSLNEICKGDDYVLSADSFSKNPNAYGLQLYNQSNGEKVMFSVIENGRGDIKTAKGTELAFNELATTAAFSDPKAVEVALDTYM